MSKVVELFGYASTKRDLDWLRVVSSQACPFLGKRCYKVRKSEPGTAIGTCTVTFGKPAQPIIICPTRLLERRQIFADCLHLLTTHEPGNELHIIPEVQIPGGNVDFFLVSVRNGVVKDFVGIELQTLDTTGTVWSERQRLLRELGIERQHEGEDSTNPYGMNWKMTAKTILVQMHHKIQTFEHLNKKLVLVVQDHLLKYMSKEFNFSHLHNPAVIGDSMHFHSYQMQQQPDQNLKISMVERLSTDADGIGRCMGLQNEAKIELELVLKTLQVKLSPATLFALV